MWRTVISSDWCCIITDAQTNFTWIGRLVTINDYAYGVFRAESLLIDCLSKIDEMFKLLIFEIVYIVGVSKLRWNVWIYDINALNFEIPRGLQQIYLKKNE